MGLGWSTLSDIVHWQSLSPSAIKNCKTLVHIIWDYISVSCMDNKMTYPLNDFILTNFTFQHWKRSKSVMMRFTIVMYNVVELSLTGKNHSNFCSFGILDYNWWYEVIIVFLFMYLVTFTIIIFTKIIIYNIRIKNDFCIVMGQVAKCRVRHTRYKDGHKKNEWLRPSQCDGGNHFLERGTHISLWWR